LHRHDNEPKHDVYNAPVPKGYRRNKPCPGCRARKYHQPSKGLHSAACKATGFKYKLRFYGITVEQFVKMFTEQDGKCRLCEKQLGSLMLNKMNIDHCHKTNKVRGLLCRGCNMGLGAFKDNVAALRKAADYVEEFGP
jgi:hypothetical protein